VRDENARQKAFFSPCLIDVLNGIFQIMVALADGEGSVIRRCNPDKIFKPELIWSRLCRSKSTSDSGQKSVIKEEFMDGVEEIKRMVDAREKAKAAREKLIEEVLKGWGIASFQKREEKNASLIEVTDLNAADIAEYLDQQDQHREPDRAKDVSVREE
jgi:hypothetical protein